MKIAQGMIATLGILCSTATFAATEQFHLSYTFTSTTYDAPMHEIPVTVTADFTGQSNGDIISDVVFKNFTYNGMVFDTWTTQPFIAGTGVKPVVSFSGYNNDFYTSGQNLDGDRFTGSFYSYTVDPTWPYPMTIGMEMYVSGVGPYYRQNPEDAEVNYTWQVTAVPEPATYGMMLVGAGLLAVCARRRQA